MQTGFQVEIKAGLGTRWAEQYLSLCEQDRREQDVVRAQIIEAGKSPDPPADWTFRE